MRSLWTALSGGGRTPRISVGAGAPGPRGLARLRLGGGAGPWSPVDGPQRGRPLRTLGIVAAGIAGAVGVVAACGGFDADGDGFFIDPLLCGGPLYDCDDSNRGVGHGQLYYLDCDSDGLGDPGNLAYLCDDTLCGSENLQIRGCAVTSNGMDCNDRAPTGITIGAGIPMYPDCDSDGLGDPSSYELYCPGNGVTPPTTLGGCSLVLNGDDCDDNALNLEQESAKVPRYLDCDDDTFGDDEVGVFYLCPKALALPRTGGIKDCTMVLAGGDCDDTDPSVNPTLGGC